MPDIASPSTGSFGSASSSSRTGRHVAFFVEPSPFTHVCGYQNRFLNAIRLLRESGDQVTVVTPCLDPPKEYHGAQVVNVLGFRLPFYRAPTLLLSLGLSVRVLWHLLTRRPDVIHVAAPGVMMFAAILYSKMLSVPLVMSYHTHVPEYIPKYTWKGLVAPMWSVIRFCHRMADLTLVTSKAMKDELSRNRCHDERIDVWQRGVDTQVFSPAHRSEAMRHRLSGGCPEGPLLLYVGRLGAEKNITALKEVLQQLPGARLAIVGDGPERAALESHFHGMPVVFTGLMRGQQLSEAYASADAFLMPSETETLGFVVLEAMASGLPVVAVRAGGIPDIITQPGVTGYLYEPKDLAHAASLTQQLLDDAALRQRVGAAARADVEKWGWGPATQRLRDEQYHRAIVARSTRRRSPAHRATDAVLAAWRAVLLAIGTVLAAVVGMLDYARPYRSMQVAGLHATSSP